MSTDTNFSAFGSEQQWIPYLDIPGVLTKYAFDKFSGGDAIANINKHRPAGMGAERTYLGLPVFGNITVSKAFVQADNAFQAKLRNAVGSTMATVTLVPLDDAGNPWGESRVFTGRLEGVKEGPTDSTSNAPRMWEVDIAVETISDQSN